MTAASSAMEARKSIPGRIVVRGTNWVGDTVISLPALKHIRKLFAGSHITVWAPDNLAEIVGNAQVCDEVLAFDRYAKGAFGRALSMSKTLRSRKFDLAILLQNAFESAFTTWLAGVPLRAGYPTDLRGPLLNIKAHLEPGIFGKHQVFYYLAIAKHVERYFFDTETAEDVVPDCSIKLPDEAMNKAAEILSRFDGDGPVFSLAAGSVNSEAKRWPVESFAALADLLAQRLNARIALLGSPDEHALSDKIISFMKTDSAVNLAGEIDLMGVMAVMKLSDAVVSNDTGSAHLAVAAAARVLTIFGPTSPGATAPYGPTAQVVQGDAPCGPCRHYHCPKPTHFCMTAVTPEMVFDRVASLV